MFSQSAKDRIKILQTYKAMIPDPLNRQFDNRVSKAEAILHKDERNKRHSYFQHGMAHVLLDSMKYSGLVKIYFQFCIFCLFLVSEQENIQTQLHQQNNTKVGPPAKKAPCCRKCHQPMKGHP